MHLVFRKVSRVILLHYFLHFFKYKPIIVNGTKHDYNITVKITETCTRHQAVMPKFFLNVTVGMFRSKLHAQTYPAQSTNVQVLLYEMQH